MTKKTQVWWIEEMTPKKTQVSMKGETYARLKAEAAERGIPVTELLESILAERPVTPPRPLPRLPSADSVPSKITYAVKTCPYCHATVELCACKCTCGASIWQCSGH